MNRTHRKSRLIHVSLAMVIGVLGLTAGPAFGDEIKVTLSGDQEVPPVATSAKGTGTITVDEDRSVSGSVTTSGVQGVAAHIHRAASGKNGPPIITLTKTSENVWSVPEGAKLTDEQFVAYEAGELYINVHSAANKPGEIRGQIKP
jgi:CHRD domain